IAHFDAALKNSPFDSQATFLAALLDEETVTRLEKQQQTLESHALAPCKTHPAWLSPVGERFLRQSL
ncbi:hypothetical protein MJL79_28480, partial [Salmonella enterica subsp. enterica serovar Montevideo]|nr:hypothetical protein [Salmonella enterica subsp. enterica serovar Montevideo]